MCTKTTCDGLSEFLRMQMAIIRKHIAEHMYLRSISDKDVAMQSFVGDYSWLIRECYCGYICDKRSECSKADKMKAVGDLLRDRRNESGQSN